MGSHINGSSIHSFNYSQTREGEGNTFLGLLKNFLAWGGGKGRIRFPFYPWFQVSQGGGTICHGYWGTAVLESPPPPEFLEIANEEVSL